MLPGAADRILTMAEKAQNSIIDNQHLAARAEAISFMVASLAISLAPWGLIVLAAILALFGRDGIAALAGCAGLLAAAPQLIAAIKGKKSE